MNAIENSRSASGGFRIEPTGEEIAVTRDLSAFGESERRRRRAALLFGGAVTAILLALELIHQFESGWGSPGSRFLGPITSIISILATGLPIGLVWSTLYPRSTSLRIDGEKITIRRHNVEFALQRDDIREIRYVDEGLSWLGHPKHISIAARGEAFKCLQGIAPSEASNILLKLQSLGYKVAPLDA